MKTCKRCGANFDTLGGRRVKLFCSNQCKVKFHNDLWNPKAPRLTSRRRGTEARKQEFSEYQKQIIRGTLLGDGSLITLKTGHHRLSMTHATAQRDYMQWKRDQLAFAFHKETPNECSKNEHKFLVISSVWHPYFDDVYTSFYHHGRKHIPSIVTENLTPITLAVWYQDDGSFSKNSTSRQAWFCTDSYPFDEVENTAQKLREQYNLNVSVYTLKAQGTFKRTRVNYKRICILRSSIADFFDIVRPHIHPCMAYKITC